MLQIFTLFIVKKLTKINLLNTTLIFLDFIIPASALLCIAQQNLASFNAVSLYETIKQNSDLFCLPILVSLYLDRWQHVSFYVNKYYYSHSNV